MLTRAEYLELCRRATQDPQPLIEQLFDIETMLLPGEQPIQKLKFNVTQQRVHDQVLAMRRDGVPPRVIVLKARRPGISTLCSGYVTATAVTRPHSESMQVAQDEMATLGLFRKIQLMIERLPTDLRPRKGVDRRNEMILDGMPCADGFERLNSKIAVATAGSEEPWRSKTLQTVHLSEFAKMAEADVVLHGILAAVTRSPESLVIIESTARGVGNSFHLEWEKAVAGESGFAPVFIPWQDLPGNRMRVPLDFERTPEEVAMAQEFGLDDQQLTWRRYVIMTECAGSIDKFNQEHPPTAAEAFILSGQPVFDITIIRRMMERARLALPPEIGVYTLEHGFTPYARGPLRVYTRPQEGHEYTIGADPSAGNPGGDPCCAVVFDRTTGDQVAIWHGHQNPIIFASTCNALGRWYNNAILAPELNAGYGNAMVEELKALQYPSPYVWSRVDKVKNVMTNFLGWWTTFRTKQYLIDTFAHALVEGDIMVYDLQILQEMEKFEYYDGVRAAGSGMPDDAVMACLIAFRVHVECPMRDTGLPPRVKYEPFVKADDGKPPIPAGPLNKEAWEDADAVLGQSRRGQRVLDELVQPNDDDLEPGQMPSYIDHPW